MPDRLAPFRLGRYECTELIGMGGMASVYRARLKTIAGFQKDYAVKKIYSHLAEQPRFLEMFVHEATLAAKLDHGNIARVLELNEDNGQYYMVLEYVNGLTLRQLLDLLGDRGQTMPWHLACFVAMETARALHYAHTATDENGQPLGLVHRDLSPSNIMLSRRGQVKVLDFGIAKALLEPSTKRSRELKGKYEYMSPEQVHGEVLDCRSDIFSLGTVLYEMLTGKALFDADSIPAILTKVERAKVPPLPGVEPLLEPVLHRMLSVDLSQRYSSAEEVRSILAQILMVRGKLVDEADLANYLTQALSPTTREQDSDDEYGERTTPDRRGGEWTGRDLDTEEETIPRDVPNEEVDSMIATKQIFPRLTVVDDSDDPEESTATGVQGMKDGARRSLAPSLLTVHEQRRKQSTPDELPPAPASLTPPPKIQIPPLKVVSSSEPEYALSPDHFSPKMQTAPVPHEDPIGTWTSRHVLILVLALLSMVVAGAAVYLAVARSGSEEPPPPPRHEWGKVHRARAGAPPRSASRTATHSNSLIYQTEPLPNKSVSGNPGAGKPTHEKMARNSALEQDAGMASTRPTGTRPTGAVENAQKASQDQLPTAVPRTGPRKRTDVDIVTLPKGAVALCGRKKMGQTPLRIRLPAQGGCNLVLNLPLHRILEKRLTRRRWGGRRFKQYLPVIARPARIAKHGTSVDTRCHGPALYRIFLNGRDSGRNCPARLRLPPGVNDVAIHLSRSRRLFYKKFRVRGGKTEIVEWTDKPGGDDP